MMSTSSWIMIGAFIAMALFTQFGWRRFTIRNVILPFVIVGIVCFSYLRTIPTGNPDLVSMGLCTLLGVAFGVLMLWSIRVKKDEDGAVKVYSGVAYLALWITAMGLRVLFAYYAQYWGRQQFGEFMFSHHISISVIAPAFVFMTLAMVLVRTIGVSLRVRRTAVVQSEVA